MKQITIILDLDGVLITTPPWKSDEMDSDGYSAFNKTCVQNFNNLLKIIDAEIWLSSTRRTVKTLEEFNEIFEHRGIITRITGFLPEYEDCKSRKDEIQKFLDAEELSSFLIIDDDKSLNALDSKTKERLILTQLTKGFVQEELQNAIDLIKD